MGTGGPHRWNHRYVVQYMYLLAEQDKIQAALGEDSEGRSAELRRKVNLMVKLTHGLEKDGSEHYISKIPVFS